MTTRPLRTAAAALLLPLSACINMSGLGGDSRYACAAPEGVACDSVSGTYANAVRDNLPGKRVSTSASDGTDDESPRPSGGTGSNVDASASAPYRQPLIGAAQGVAAAGADGRTSRALRSQARVLRLWTKPWEDADGDLWDQGYVYVHVDAGGWQIDHVRQRIRDRYAPLRPPASAAASGTPSSPAQSGRTGGGLGDGAVRRAIPSAFGADSTVPRPSGGLGNRPQ